MVMLRFKWSALLCAIAIGFSFLTFGVASAQDRQAMAPGCHKHGKLVCCGSGCTDPRRKASSRPVQRASCHWHGCIICCGGVCLDTCERLM
jgi:hypothetical protein